MARNIIASGDAQLPAGEAVTLETHFTETFVARLAAREKQMQQHYRPVISVHKWFARRPGALFRALVLHRRSGLS